MLLIRKHFPEIISDNEEIYISHLRAIIERVDELSSLQISKSIDGYNFRLVPSLPKYTSLLIEEILKIHNLFNIHLDISKSIKASGTVVFKITM